MQKIFVLFTLATVTTLSADQYENRSGYNTRYQDGSNYQQDGSYYQDDNYQPRGRSNRRQNRQCCPDRNNQYYQQQPSYDQNQGNQYYDQNQGNQNYDRNQGTQNYERNQSNNYGSQKNVSDQDLNKNLQDKLGSGWFSKGYQNVSYDVNNGVVTLKGTVETLDDKTKVDEEVRKMDGVRQVNNQIRVAPTTK